MTRPFAIPALLTAALLSACAYFACGALYAERGEPNADEGFYAYASYAVMHGRVPYRDFAYTQTPLLPYIQGAVFSAVGYGVRQERWLNVAWGTLAVALAALLWSSASVPTAWRVLLVLSWCLCKPLVFLSTSGKTYGIVGLLMIGASACVYLRQTPWARAPEGRLRPHLLLCALSALCVLSVGCRLTAAPSAVLLWAGFAVLDRGRISKALLLAIPVLFSLVLIGPFYALDPRNAVYWTWIYHHLNMVSELSRPSRIGLLVESCRVAPAPAAFGLAGIALVGRALFRALRQGAGGASPSNTAFQAGGWILAAGAVGWVLPVLLSGVYAEYATPSMPVVLTGFGLLLSRTQAPLASLGDGLRARMAAFLPICAGALLVGYGLAYGYNWLMPGYLDAIDRTARVVRSATRETDTVLTSMPEIPLAAGRRLFPRLEMGKFGVTGEMDPVTSRARHILPFRELRDAVASGSPEVVVLFVKNQYWDFGWSIPSFRMIPEESYRGFLRDLGGRYVRIDSNDYFVVFKARPRVAPAGPAGTAP
ncbi:MAG: hypothetical protein WCA95_04905 [Opitutaceae bacterium]